jgi:hypothetical protein
LRNPPSDFTSDSNSPSAAARPRADSGSPKEDTMIRIKVQYDALNRTFKLVDEEFKTLLEGDVLYDLNVPLVFEDEEAEELIPSINAIVAHA